MKTMTEIIRIISDSIADAARNISKDVVPDIDSYDLVVCTERVFIDDYARPKMEYLKRMNNDNNADNLDGPQEVHDPLDVPYQNTIFIVLKVGQGQINKAVLNMPISIQCLSEQNDYETAGAILREFCNKYNFEYTDGIVMSFYTPEMISSGEEVYDGFRALISSRGTVKVPEDGLLVTTEIWSYDDTEGNKGWFKLPFLTLQDNLSIQTDPQSFAGYQGRTMNINRQSTTTESVDGYLWNYSKEAIKAVGPDSDEGRMMRHLNYFSQKVLFAKKHMNVRFRLYFKTNMEVTDGDVGYDSIVATYLKDTDAPIESGTNQGIRTEHGYYMADAEGWFTLAGRSYSQAWGDVSPRSMTFTEAMEE
jgi:hypothetical protein